MGRWPARLAPLVVFTLFVAAAPARAANAVTNCDPLDPAACMLPFPNDLFTKADPSTPTGLRIDFRLADMPRNVAEKPIDPAPYNMNDGFSPGQEIVTHVPGLDNQKAFDATGAVPISDVARSFDANQPVVVIDAATLKRRLIWSEVDANPAADTDRNLLIHPAVNWQEGHHYIVALRNLRDANGDPIQAQLPFREYRDRIATSDPSFEARRPHMEWIFRRLAKAGIARGSLYLAWDFTVASRQNLSERALYMRDDAFKQLGDTNLRDMKVQGAAPTFTVTQTTDFTPDQNANVAREVQGEFLVPCYLNAPGCPPGASMAFAPGSDTPLRLPGNTMAANFDCIIPRAAADAPARASLYGHGLFGSASEVTAGNVESMANEHDFVFCATDWVGMAEADLPNAFSALADLSRFNTIPDRMQQAYVNFMYLGRLMIHPDGFASNSAFQLGGKPAIETSHLFYDGNSQGGIEGGALTALAPDFDHAVLGVPGMNYSLLIRRSSDFDPFAAVLYKAYPSELERPLIISMLQMLWDRGDSDGYAEHMTSRPYPNTPAHKVLLEMAFGDHQVTNWATEVEARTIGARLRTPALDPGRSPEVTPYFGVAPITSFPYDGSALVVWDIGPTRNGGAQGTDPPPLGELPDRGGQDPHEAPRSEASNRLQKSDFLQPGGQVVDVCGDHPCYAWGWTGP
ncbi:MAG TPA: hypothetical protein VF032_15120 [Thermoleophilaceae bacterium]